MVKIILNNYEDPKEYNVNDALNMLQLASDAGFFVLYTSNDPLEIEYIRISLKRSH